MIVKAALEVCEREGLDGLTFGPLATQLGISKSGIFTHFKTRDALIQGVIEQATREFVATVLAPAVRSPRGLPRLRQILKNWVDYYLDLEGRRRIFIYNGGAGIVRDILADIHGKWRQEIVRAIQQAQQEGHLAGQLDAEQLAFRMQGVALAGYHYRHILGDPRAAELASEELDRVLEPLIAAK